MTFPEAPNLAVQVFWQESNLQMKQSKLRYTAKNVQPGFKVGDQEQSFCLAQIHEPAHKHTIKKHGLEDFKTNVESCVKLARIVYDQSGGFSLGLSIIRY
jgi:hypothetical protein